MPNWIRVSWISDLFRLLFPPLCNGCKCKLLDSEYLFCTDCRIDTPFTFDWRVRENPLERALNFSASVEWGAAFMDYHTAEDRYGGVIKRFKFETRPDFAYNMGKWFGTVLVQEGVDFSNIDLLVAVPLHYKRWLWRGYNQSYVIAKGLGSVLGIKVAKGAVSRIKNTPFQSQRKGRIEREQNVKGAFRVKNPDMLSGKNIVIIDDVFTTGSTVTELIKAIKQSCEQCNIWVAVVARA